MRKRVAPRWYDAPQCTPVTGHSPALSPVFVSCRSDSSVEDDRAPGSSQQADGNLVRIDDDDGDRVAPALLRRPAIWACGERCGGLPENLVQALAFMGEIDVGEEMPDQRTAFGIVTAGFAGPLEVSSEYDPEQLPGHRRHDDEKGETCGPHQLPGGGDAVMQGETGRERVHDLTRKW